MGVGVLVLTGAGTTTAYRLSIPPFQGLEPGTERSIGGVPVNYQTDAGTLVSCVTFIESRGLEPRQRRQIDVMIRQTDWSGYGQRTYEALPSKDRAAQTGPGAVGDEVAEDLRRRAAAAAPGVTVGAEGGPTITGTATTCTYPDGAP